MTAAHQSLAVQQEVPKLQLVVVSPESEEFRANLRQTRDIYYKLGKENYFSKADQELLTVINKAAASDGTPSQFSELTPEAKDLLRMCNISPEAFDKMAGDKLQQHLYNETATILHDQANLLAQHHDNKQIQEYIQATTDMSVVALDMIRTGNPQEAIATVNMAQSFHEATEIAIGALKGAGTGAAIGVASKIAMRFMPPHVQVAFAVLSKASLVYEAVNIHENYAKFMALSPKEQAEQISTFFSAYYTNKLLNHPRFVKAWKDAAKICKAELAGLAGLVTVEAELAVPVAHAGANPSAAAPAAHPELAMFGNHPAPPLPQSLLNGSAALPNPLLVSTGAQTAAGVQVPSAGTTAAPSSTANAVESCLQKIESTDFKKYWESLIKDPAHGNKVSIQSMEEAVAGIAAEQQGFLTGPLRRDLTGAAEFIDKFGQKWDVKRAISHASNGKYIFNPEHLLSKIKGDLMIGENVILDMTKLESKDIPILYSNVVQNLTKEEIKRIIVVIKEETLNTIG